MDRLSKIEEDLEKTTLGLNALNHRQIQNLLNQKTIEKYKNNQLNQVNNKLDKFQNYITNHDTTARKQVKFENDQEINSDFIDPTTSLLHPSMGTQAQQNQYLHEIQRNKEIQNFAMQNQINPNDYQKLTDFFSVNNEIKIPHKMQQCQNQQANTLKKYEMALLNKHVNENTLQNQMFLPTNNGGALEQQENNFPQTKAFNNHNSWENQKFDMNVEQKAQKLFANQHANNGETFVTKENMFLQETLQKKSDMRNAIQQQQLQQLLLQQQLQQQQQKLQQQQKIQQQQILQQRESQMLKENEGELLDESLVMQVDIFYRSQKSEVFVANCKANLLLGPSLSFDKQTNVQQIVQTHKTWTFSRSGAPVLVLDTQTGELLLILAEVGSGFTLWKNRFSSMTDYTVITANLHALKTDPLQQKPHSSLRPSVVCLEFANTSSANEFYKEIIKLYSLSSMGKSTKTFIENGKLLKKAMGKHNSQSTTSLFNKKNQPTSQKLSKKSFSKVDISQPCCFTHVTKLADKLKENQ